jgi:hypothetical protein
MAWTNYRSTVERFSHIDAEFVKATSNLSPEGGTAELVVRFYPWWEHPLYMAARDRDDNWGFSSYDRGKRDVTVRAIAPWVVRLSPRREIVDWRFEEQHPLLWDLADRSTVYANAPFDRHALIDGLMALELSNVSEHDLISHLGIPPTGTAPLGITLPAQLHDAVLTVFRQLGVPVLSAGSPRSSASGVVFLIDADDYIIARDFEVDVPEFVHEAEWFQPDAPGNTG